MPYYCTVFWCLSRERNSDTCRSLRPLVQYVLPNGINSRFCQRIWLWPDCLANQNPIRVAVFLLGSVDLALFRSAGCFFGNYLSVLVLWHSAGWVASIQEHSRGTICSSQSTVQRTYCAGLQQQEFVQALRHDMAPRSHKTNKNKKRLCVLSDGMYSAAGRAASRVLVFAFAVTGIVPNVSSLGLIVFACW